MKRPNLLLGALILCGIVVVITTVIVFGEIYLETHS